LNILAAVHAAVGLDAVEKVVKLVGFVASAEGFTGQPGVINGASDLMAEVFPSVPLRRPVEGRETLLAIDHARRLLGYEPAYRWQEQLG